MVSAESEILGAECEALKEFHHRVSNATPSMPKRQPRATTMQARSLQKKETILDTYRDTFMSLSHYQDDYGESALENLREEFGEEVAALVDRRSLLAYDAAAHGAQIGISNRQTMMHRLEIEQEQIDRIRRELASVHRKVNRISVKISEGDAELLSGSGNRLEPTTDLARLEEWESNCDRLIAKRQKCLLAHDGELSNYEFTLVRFLYQSLDVDFPVLASIAELCDRIRSTRDAVGVAMR